MVRKKVKLEWISRNAFRRSTFRKRRECLLKKVRQLSILCDVKACAIIYDPDEQISRKPETWPSEEETKEILSSFKSMPEMERSRKMVDQEEYLRQSVEKLEEQKSKIISNNMEILLTIFLYKCMVGERSVGDLRTVDEAEGLLRVIEQKEQAVKDRIKTIRKGKMVIAEEAEVERNHDSDLKSDDQCNCEVNTVVVSADYSSMVDGNNDDLFWSFSSNNGDGELIDMIRQPCFKDGQSSSWMETLIMDGDYNVVTGNGDDFFCGYNSCNGDGGLEEVVGQPCFNVGESSSWMGPSSSLFLDDSSFN